MTLDVVRTADAWYLTTSGGAAVIDTTATSTAELLADLDAVGAARDVETLVPLSSLDLISPVTAPCRVIAQMTNFASHAKDAGFDPDRIPLTFFRKSSASISGPNDDIVKPAHVRLLDYEVEIGFVVGRDVPVGTEVTATDLPEIVRALVITNDVSARDVQLVKTQFYEAKSYPTFTPTGPVLVILEDDEIRRFSELQLRLWVNGELRQDMGATDMIYGPLEALRGLSRFQDLSTGDLILTGTPVGTALQAPPKPVEVIASVLPTATKWRLFFKGQANNPRYLQDGDLVEVSIATNDRAIDLGTQTTKVRFAR